MRACPERSRGDGFAAKAAPTTESHVKCNSLRAKFSDLSMEESK
jgi:hypothetical protein